MPSVHAALRTLLTVSTLVSAAPSLFDKRDTSGHLSSYRNGATFAIAGVGGYCIGDYAADHQLFTNGNTQVCDAVNIFTLVDGLLTDVTTQSTCGGTQAGNVNQFQCDNVPQTFGLSGFAGNVLTFESNGASSSAFWACGPDAEGGYNYYSPKPPTGEVNNCQAVTLSLVDKGACKQCPNYTPSTSSTTSSSSKTMSSTSKTTSRPHVTTSSRTTSSSSTTSSSKSSSTTQTTRSRPLVMTSSSTQSSSRSSSTGSTASTTGSSTTETSTTKSSPTSSKSSSGLTSSSTHEVVTLSGTSTATTTESSTTVLTTYSTITVPRTYTITTVIGSSTTTTITTSLATTVTCITQVPTTTITTVYTPSTQTTVLTSTIYSTVLTTIYNPSSTVQTQVLTVPVTITSTLTTTIGLETTITTLYPYVSTPSNPQYTSPPLTPVDNTVTVTVVTTTSAVTTVYSTDCPAGNIQTITVSECISSPLPTGTCASTSTLYPYLLVPVASATPEKSFGSVYTPTIDADTALIAQFGIPDNGLTTCSLEFHLPGTGSNPGSQTSSYALSGTGSIVVNTVDRITSSATYGEIVLDSMLGSFSLQEGSTAYLSAPFTCAEASAKAFELVSNRQSVTFFEDYNLPAVGLVLVQTC